METRTTECVAFFFSTTKVLKAMTLVQKNKFLVSMLRRSQSVGKCGVAMRAHLVSFIFGLYMN